jgi:hypothetical protein
VIGSLKSDLLFNLLTPFIIFFNNEGLSCV